MINLSSKSFLNLSTIIIIATCNPSYALNNFKNESNSLPLPENEIFGKEQLFLKPFKTIEDEALTCGQLIVSRGFKYEIHNVTTVDGYHLTMYRIINPYARAACGKKLVPVVLVHGSLVSCASFMFNQPDGHIKPWVNGKPPDLNSSNLAFVLGNGEWDVWIANSRGTAYSLGHSRLNYKKDPAYWNFTYVDMGKYDAPAMIDYMIQVTGYDKIVWIGYSQGNIQMLSRLAKYPPLADKLLLNFALAPIAFFGDPPGIFGLIPRNRAFYMTLAKYVGPVPPSLSVFNAGLTSFCSIPIFKSICIEVYNYLFGPDPSMVNKTRFQVITSQIDTVSNKLALHSNQAFGYDRLREYDYGPKLNIEYYGSSEPPAFAFENVPTHNLVLIHSANDYLAKADNVRKLLNTLQGDPLVNHNISYPLWSHTDYIFGEQAYQYSHSVIVDVLREHVPSSCVSNNQPKSRLNV